ncbi:MAG: MotA/TolQ/ExbB proton channel family protein [Sneathiella sp.]|nr:MotA/TolQ/ExbB proton channel family protein [Sneathiella sp.]
MLPEILGKLGMMGWPLVGCSIVATMILLERLVFVLFIDGRGKRLKSLLHEVLGNLMDKPRDLRDDAISLHLDHFRKPYDRGINMLRLIATISPIIGLLGTILGIIGAFQKIAATTDPVTPNLIADGLWEALMTTAAGLMIALPCVLVAGLLGFWRGAVLDRVTTELNHHSLSKDLHQGDSFQSLSGGKAA